MTKLESIASSAVRAADKVGAALIIVYTQSGTSVLAFSQPLFRTPSSSTLHAILFYFKQLAQQVALAGMSSPSCIVTTSETT